MVKYAQTAYTERILDTIDIDKHIVSGIDLTDLMEELDEEYGKNYKDDTMLEGCLFNWMDRYEFANYLDRKGYTVVEEITPRHIVYRR